MYLPGHRERKKSIMDISSIASMYSDAYANAVNSQTDKLKAKLNSGTENASDDELMDACKQFEAYFLEQIFKGMEKTVMKADTSNSANNQLTDYYKDMMIQKLAEQSTEQNSLGLAQMLYEQMKINMGVDPSVISADQIG